MNSKLIFYRADNADATWLDKLIAWAENCPYSHVELVLREDENYYYTIGCHAQRGGVSKGILSKLEKWDAYEIPAQEKAYFPDYLGEKYDWLGLVKVKAHWFPAIKHRWVCSTFMAEIFGLANPKFWGVTEILNWCEQTGRKV